MTMKDYVDREKEREKEIKMRIYYSAKEKEGKFVNDGSRGLINGKSWVLANYEKEGSPVEEKMVQILQPL